MDLIKRILGNRTFVGILGVYFLFAVILFVSSISNMEAFPEEFPAEDFTLKDIFGGDDLALGDYSGRPLIIYFFASV